MSLVVFVNGQACTVQQGLSLSDCLVQLGYTDEIPVATAVNEMFIPCGMRSETVLENGDRLEILSAMQGG